MFDTLSLAKERTYIVELALTGSKLERYSYLNRLWSQRVGWISRPKDDEVWDLELQE